MYKFLFCLLLINALYAQVGLDSKRSFDVETAEKDKVAARKVDTYEDHVLVTEIASMFTII